MHGSPVIIDSFQNHAFLLKAMVTEPLPFSLRPVYVACLHTALQHHCLALLERRSVFLGNDEVLDKLSLEIETQQLFLAN